MRLNFKFRKPSLQSWQLWRHLHTWAWISSSTLQYLLLTSTLTFTMESYCWFMVNSSMGLFPLDAYFSQQYLLQSLISLLKRGCKTAGKTFLSQLPGVQIGTHFNKLKAIFHMQNHLQAILNQCGVLGPDKGHTNQNHTHSLFFFQLVMKNQYWQSWLLIKPMSSRSTLTSRTH